MTTTWSSPMAPIGCSTSTGVAGATTAVGSPSIVGDGVGRGRTAPSRRCPGSATRVDPDAGAEQRDGAVDDRRGRAAPTARPGRRRSATRRAARHASAREAELPGRGTSARRPARRPAWRPACRRRDRRGPPGTAGSAARPGHVDAACSSAAILRACSGSTRRVALGGGEQRRRVGRAVDDVVVRRVGVQPGELLGDVGVAVLVGPQPGDQELREADHVEQRHAAPHGAAEVGALGQGDADEQAAVGPAEDRRGGRARRGPRRRASRRRRGSRRTRSAWCRAARRGATPRPPRGRRAARRWRTRPPAAHQAAICGDHTGVSEMAKPP